MSSDPNTGTGQSAKLDRKSQFTRNLPENESSKAGKQLVYTDDQVEVIIDAINIK
jgi:hypothetical protein